MKKKGHPYSHGNNNSVKCKTSFIIDNTWLSLWAIPYWNMSFRPKNETYTLAQVQVRIGKRLVLGTHKYLNIREDVTIRLNHLFCFDKICNKPFSVGSPSPHASACKMKWNLNTSIDTILHYCCCIRSLCSNQLNCITSIKIQQEMLRTSHIQVLL